MDVFDSAMAPAMAERTAIMMPSQYLTFCGSMFLLLMVLLFYCAKIHIFLNCGIFFHSTCTGVGVARGGGGPGWVGCEGRRTAAASRGRRGTAARGGHAHGRRAEGCAWEEGGRAHGPPRETAQRAHGWPPPSACGAWEGRRAWGCAWECFTWNIIVTGSLSVRYGSPQLPRLLQTYRNCPSNTLLG